jgi:Arc/MetJ-type ribon-helix-helix transcriptional regulator
MQILVDNPKLETFVKEQVEAGRYPSAKELVEAAVARLMLDPPAMLSEAEEKALDDAEACIARGDTLDWTSVSAELRQKYLKST